MSNRNKMLALILIALLQLLVLGFTFMSHKKVAGEGKLFAFRLLPPDSNAQLFGEYYYPEYASSQLPKGSDSTLHEGDKVFLQFDTDSAGYAKIKSVSRTAPQNTSDFLMVQMGYEEKSHPLSQLVHYPFQGIHTRVKNLDGTPAPYLKVLRDSAEIATLRVKILNGKGAVVGVFIGNNNIHDCLKAQMH